MRASVGGLAADERGFGALVGGLCAVDRALMDGDGVCGVALLAGGEADHGPGFAERLLVGIASGLRVIEGFLIDVAVDLFAIDPGLAVVKDRRQA